MKDPAASVVDLTGRAADGRVARDEAEPPGPDSRPARLAGLGGIPRDLRPARPPAGPAQGLAGRRRPRPGAGGLPRRGVGDRPLGPRPGAGDVPGVAVPDQSQPGGELPDRPRPTSPRQRRQRHASSSGGPARAGWCRIRAFRRGVSPPRLPLGRRPRPPRVPRRDLASLLGHRRRRPAAEGGRRGALGAVRGGGLHRPEPRAWRGPGRRWRRWRGGNPDVFSLRGDRQHPPPSGGEGTGTSPLPTRPPAMRPTPCDPDRLPLTTPGRPARRRGRAVGDGRAPRGHVRRLPSTPWTGWPPGTTGCAATPARLPRRRRP